jgi:hypothetical protein
MRRIASVLLVVACLAAGYAAGSNQLLASRVAVAADECQIFPETGKQVCGRFLEYWRANGGLAQQGFPLSNVFDEKSDVDGKTYKVQYFERAVFELHPENRPPYDVLLSLVGREKYQAKYPLGEPGTAPPPPAATQKYTGSGTDVVQGVRLSAGLAFMRVNYSGGPSSKGSVIGIEWRDSKGEVISYGDIESDQPTGDNSVAFHVPASDTHIVNIKSNGSWTLEITQPGPAEFASAASLPVTFSGKGKQHGVLFKAEAGLLLIKVESSGTKQAGYGNSLTVRLYDGQGKSVGEGPSGDMPLNATKGIQVPKSGVYILYVSNSYYAPEPQGNWTVTATQ